MKKLMSLIERITVALERLAAMQDAGEVALAQINLRVKVARDRFRLAPSDLTGAVYRETVVTYLKVYKELNHQEAESVINQYNRDMSPGEPVNPPSV